MLQVSAEATFGVDHVTSSENACCCRRPLGRIGPGAVVPTLTQQDLDMIHSTVANQIHGKPIGTIVSWINSASGNSGSISLVKKPARNRQQCEGSNTRCARRAHRFAASTIISPTV
jgi:hypothetical protein